MMPKIALGIGDSHLGSLISANVQAVRDMAPLPFRLVQLGGGAIAYDVVLQSERRGEMLNPLIDAALRDAATALDRAESELDVFVLLGGFIVSRYTWSSRGEFDIYVDGLQAHPSGDVPLLPRDALLATLAHDTRPLMAGLAQLQRRVGRVRLVSAPPPHRSDEALRQARLRGQRVNSQDLTRPMHAVVRLKVWKLADLFFAEACQRVGVGYVSPPSASVEADGFLKGDYEKDGFHANAAYGRLMLEHLEAIFGE
jgi:hypothetical protein